MNYSFKILLTFSNLVSFRGLRFGFLTECYTVLNSTDTAGLLNLTDSSSGNQQLGELNLNVHVLVEYVGVIHTSTPDWTHNVCPHWPAAVHYVTGKSCCRVL